MPFKLQKKIRAYPHVACRFSLTALQKYPYRGIVLFRDHGLRDRIQIFGQKWAVLVVNKFLSWFVNFQTVPLIRCCHCHIQCGLGENILEDQHLLEKYLLNFFSVLVVSIVLAPMYFSKLIKKTIRGPRRNSKICLRPPKMAGLFTEIYWSVGEIIIT